MQKFKCFYWFWSGKKKIIINVKSWIQSHLNGILPVFGNKFTFPNSSKNKPGFISGSSFKAIVSCLIFASKSFVFLLFLLRIGEPDLIVSHKSRVFANSCIRMQSMNLKKFGWRDDRRRNAAFIDSRADVVRISASFTEIEARAFFEKKYLYYKHILKYTQKHANNVVHK